MFAYIRSNIQDGLAGAYFALNNVIIKCNVIANWIQGFVSQFFKISNAKLKVNYTFFFAYIKNN